MSLVAAVCKSNAVPMVNVQVQCSRLAYTTHNENKRFRLVSRFEILQNKTASSRCRLNPGLLASPATLAQIDGTISVSAKHIRSSYGSMHMSVTCLNTVVSEPGSSSIAISALIMQ